MNKNSYNWFLLALAMGLTLMVGCKKDPADNPIDPANPGQEVATQYVFWGTDSVAIKTVVMTKVYESIEYTLVLADESMLKVSVEGNVEDGVSRSFVTYDAYERAPLSHAWGMVVDDDDWVEFVSGTFTLSGASPSYHLVISAIDEKGREVAVDYQGSVISLNAPSGAGSFFVANAQMDISVAYAVRQYGAYEYALTDTSMLSGITFYSYQPLDPGRTYTITTDEEELISGQGVMLYVEVDANTETGGYISGDAVSGTLSCSKSGEQYTLTFSGDGPFGHFTGNYSGLIIQIY